MAVKAQLILLPYLAPAHSYTIHIIYEMWAKAYWLTFMTNIHVCGGNYRTKFEILPSSRISL